ncbi:MAG: aspartate 1-decarboxylase [Candidatus Theseobacter exili]|nr:aspartate 1-decarboxylase [Candidatus Theseobacter exili]
MLRTMLQSKIHGAIVTEADLNYMGSISIDKELMERAGLYPFEKVLVVNLATGIRAETYVIEVEKGSGKIGLNGGLARLGAVGDKILILCFVQLEESEVGGLKPTVLLMNDKNKIEKEI